MSRNVRRILALPLCDFYGRGITTGFAGIANISTTTRYLLSSDQSIADVLKIYAPCGGEGVNFFSP